MPIRLGEIAYINALPLKLSLQQLAGEVIEWHPLQPAQLNDAIAHDQLDVSPVSSAFYLRHQDNLICLDGFSIASQGAVGSVLLFLPPSTTPLEPPPSGVYVPTMSETSTALLTYLFFCHFGIKPQLKSYPTGNAFNLLEKGNAVLAFGNEALQLAVHPQLTSCPCWDLGERWQNQTGLPFLFAVWVARKAWAATHPQALLALQAAWNTQREMFEQNCPDACDQPVQDKIVQQAMRICPELPEPAIRHYLTQQLHFRFSTNEQKALNFFKDILAWIDYDAPIPTAQPHVVGHHSGVSF